MFKDVKKGSKSPFMPLVLINKKGFVPEAFGKLK